MHKNSNAPNFNQRPGQRFAPVVARAIVRVWPAESREWGHAFAAELPAAENAGAAISWLIGGLMLLLREWLKHAWRSLGRPLGSNASEAAATFTPRYSRTPRTPLWLMLALTLASAVILLHPEVRQALTFLRSAYSHECCWNPDDSSSVKKLRRISKTNRDPQLLALLSLLSTDPAERSQLSQEAIQKDPSLTWLDYEQSWKPTFDLRKQPNLATDRLDRLQKWDPDNSVPHTLAADLIARPIQLEQYDAIDHGTRLPDVEKQLAAIPAWIAEMHAAFSAPKYDNYTAQSTELVRTVARQFSVRDPRIAEYLLSLKRTPSFDMVNNYVHGLIARGSAFEKAGNPQQAIDAYSEAFHFAQRVKLNAEIPNEQYFAEEVGLAAGEKLAPLYTSLGRPDEASMVSFQMAQWKSEHDPRIFRYVPLRYYRAEFKSIAWSGLLINLTGLSILLILPLTLISVLFVFTGRKTPPAQRGFTDFCASIFADAAPWLLVASSLLLYFTYHPYAQISRAFLDGGLAAPTLQSFMSAMMVPQSIPDTFSFLHEQYSQWLALTVALALLLVIFLVRLAPNRTKPTA